MATFEDAARIALALPGVTEMVKWRSVGWARGDKRFAWERPFTKADIGRDGEPPEGDIIAIAVADEHEKQALIAAEPQWFLTISHFANYSAVLLALRDVPLERLERILFEAYESAS